MKKNDILCLNDEFFLSIDDFIFKKDKDEFLSMPNIWVIKSIHKIYESKYQFENNKSVISSTNKISYRVFNLENQKTGYEIPKFILEKYTSSVEDYRNLKIDKLL